MIDIFNKKMSKKTLGSRRITKKKTSNTLQKK